jgi:hypothetical protein
VVDAKRKCSREGKSFRVTNLPGVLPISRIGLSRKRHLPTIFVGEQSYYPWAFARTLLKSLQWTFTEVSQGLFEVRHKGTVMTLTKPYAFGLAREYFTEWNIYYLPDFSLKGKTVLDVGGGGGESAYFFLQHGAAEVLTVERNEIAAGLIDANIRRNNWPVKRVGGTWNNSILDTFPCDFMKMDIEGDERELLRLDQLQIPAVIETHTPEVTSALCLKFGMKARTVREKMAWMVSNCQ